MAHFARIDRNNKVIQVIVVDNKELQGTEFPESEAVGQKFIKDIGLPGIWVQTSYNKKFRKNFAGRDFTFDRINDVFIPPQPYKSWSLDNNSFTWNPPIPMPKDNNFYDWDEDSLSWKILPTMSGISTDGEPDYDLE
jgi:hypothetical protein